LNYGARLNGGGKALVKLGGLESNEESLLQIESLIIAACGTSFLAGKYVEIMLRKLNCFNYVEAKTASEIEAHDF